MIDTILLVLILLGVITTLWRISEMREQIDELEAEVQEATTVMESAEALLGGLAAKIRDNVEDAEKLEELADELDKGANRLAEAVAANTAAEDEDQSGSSSSVGSGSGGDTTGAGSEGGGSGGEAGAGAGSEAGTGDGSAGDGSGGGLGGSDEETRV